MQGAGRGEQSPHLSKLQTLLFANASKSNYKPALQLTIMEDEQLIRLLNSIYKIWLLTHDPYELEFLDIIEDCPLKQRLSLNVSTNEWILF